MFSFASALKALNPTSLSNPKSNPKPVPHNDTLLPPREADLPTPTDPLIRVYYYYYYNYYSKRERKEYPR